VRQAGLLLLILLALAVSATGGHAEGLPTGPATDDAALDQPLVGDVMRVALGFLAPRTLEPTSIPELADWGLRGLSSLDPRLAVSLRADGKTAGSLRLTGADGRTLLERPTPAADDAAGWGVAIGQMVRAGWDNAAAIRAAGTEGVIQSFFDELFSHMDMYSRYAPPQEADAERGRRAGRAGVGITPAARGGGFVAAEVQPNGPAALGGIRPGERILAIDGRSTQRADLAVVDERLAGPEGSIVSVVLRGLGGHVRTVELVRARVPPETVTSARNGDMLVITISSFSRDTGVRLAQELIRGMSDPRPPHGVVLDLRDNRGGVLRQAVASAAMLQDSGIVAVTAGRDPQAAHVFLADGRDLAQGLPVVVLVDGGSASAAEIVAASLADQRRAVVVGSATLGKGLVQTIAPLPNGGELFVTWSRVLAPLGWPLQGLGVLPQVCTSLGQEVLGRQLTELVRGVQPMQAALERDRAARAPLSPAEVLGLRAACPAARGRAADMGAARYLIDTPDAYRTALLRVTLPGPAGPLAARGLTPKAAVSN
jgi:carboxyl-terminal processing protease